MPVVGHPTGLVSDWFITADERTHGIKYPSAGWTSSASSPLLYLALTSHPQWEHPGLKFLFPHTAVLYKTSERENKFLYWVDDSSAHNQQTPALAKWAVQWCPKGQCQRMLSSPFAFAYKKQMNGKNWAVITRACSWQLADDSKWNKYIAYDLCSLPQDKPSRRFWLIGYMCTGMSCPFWWQISFELLWGIYRYWLNFIMP